MASTSLGRWAERHEPLTDGVVAALLFLFNAMYLAGQYAGFGDLSWPLLVVAAQPLLAKDYLRIGEVGVLVVTGLFVATVGLCAQARRRHVERLRELNAQLARERDAQAVIAATEERARIAREIDDIVSHSLGTMVVMADGAAQTATADPEQSGRAMARVRDTGREAMGEMRRMLGVLREDGAASRAPQPGLGSLDRLLDEAHATGLRVDLHVRDAPVALPAGVDLAAYRIVQEALTNAHKHGGPLLSLVTVTVSYLDDAIDLRIVDDGAEATTVAEDGVDTPWSSGHGLVGMRERASAYGGSLEAGSRLGGEFEVHAVLPIGGERGARRRRFGWCWSMTRRCTVRGSGWC